MAAIDDLRSIRLDFERFSQLIVSDERSLDDALKNLKKLLNKDKVKKKEVEELLKARRKKILKYKLERDAAFKKAEFILASIEKEYNSGGE